MTQTSGIAWFSNVFIAGICLMGINVAGPSLATAAPKSITDLQDQILIQQGEITALQEQLDALKATVTDLGVRSLYTRSGSNFVVIGDTLVALNEDNITRTAAFNVAGDLTVTYEAKCSTSASNNSLTVRLELVNLDTNPETITLLPPAKLFVGGGEMCFSDSLSQGSRNSITGVAIGLPRANYAVQVRALSSFGYLTNSVLIVRK